MQKISKNAQVIIHVHVHVPLSKQFIVQGSKYIISIIYAWPNWLNNG